MPRFIYTCAPKTGSITISKVVTGLPEDETYFHVTITGQGSEPTIVDGYVKQGEPQTFDNLPFDTYIITEDDQEGYSLTSIVSDTVVLSRSNRNESVVVTNSVASEDTLELTWDDIVNVPVADASSVSDWNTFFDLPTNGSPFTSVEVVGDVVKLRGGSGITIKNAAFQANNGIMLTSIVDNANCVVALGNGVFSDNIMNTIDLPACVTTGDSVLIFTSIIHLRLNSLLVFSDSFFTACSGIEEIYLPSLTNLGSTVGDDGYGVFDGFSLNVISLTIPLALMTCNAGLPDGDIQTLVANNTVTIFDPDNNQIYP